MFSRLALQDSALSVDIKPDLEDNKLTHPVKVINKKMPDNITPKENSENIAIPNFCKNILCWSASEKECSVKSINPNGPKLLDLKIYKTILTRISMLFTDICRTFSSKA
jgi:hypothetical protein